MVPDGIRGAGADVLESAKNAGVAVVQARIETHLKLQRWRKRSDVAALHMLFRSAACTIRHFRFKAESRY